MSRVHQRGEEQGKLIVNMLDAGQICRCEDLRHCDKGHIVMIRGLGENISETIRPLGSAVVSA